MSKIEGISNTNNYNNNAGKVSSETTSDFSSYLGESKSLDEIFDKAAEKYGVPVELLKAVGKAESGFDSNAVSRCGAQGIMQLMPATAKSLGVTDSFDAEQNIMGGAKYLSGLLKKYDGDTSLTLAAYNAGSGNVAKYDGIPPFKETQNYVKKVIGYMEQGGIDTTSVNFSSSNTVSSNTTSSNIVHVASVTIPTPIQSNLSYLLLNNSNNSVNSVTDMESLFTYDDYMKFIDLLLVDENKEDTNENTKNYSTKDINYNATVLNLLSEQKSF